MQSLKPSLLLTKTLLLLIVLTLSSCTQAPQKEAKLRLGYLLNITHAVAIVGIETKAFTDTKAIHFVSGGYLLNALITDNVDIAYIGPGPYINAINKGIKLKLLGLSAVGANSLILSKKFNPEKDFVIKRLAVPQLGNTQDLLAKLLVQEIKKHQQLQEIMSPEMKEILADSRKITIDDSGFEYLAINPAELETAFFTGDIDAALVPEPWGTILEEKGLVNLADFLAQSPRNFIDELEPSFDKSIKSNLANLNQFPTTLLVVNEDFYTKNPDLVEDFLNKQNSILSRIKSEPKTVVKSIRKHFKKITHKKFSKKFIETCLAKVKFSDELENEKLDQLLELAYQAKYFRRTEKS